MELGQIFIHKASFKKHRKNDITFPPLSDHMRIKPPTTMTTEVQKDTNSWKGISTSGNDASLENS